MGFKTCGVGACAINTKNCVSSIANMVFKIIKSTIQIAFAVTSLGGSSFLSYIGNLQMSAATLNQITDQIAKSKATYIQVYEEAS